jgi:stage V sporulation protein B
VSDSGGASGVADAGAVRNTVMQLATQIAGVVFTGGLTLFLVRELGVAGYGVYALAVSIGGLLVLPAGLGLPMAVGRFLADHRSDVGQVRAILRLGLRLQVPAAAAASVGLFALAGPIASAYGQARLGWPLRWAAVSVFGQTVFAFLSYVPMSVRQSRLALWMALAESAVETASAIALVLAGAGAAGATLGKAIGYAVGAAAGLVLALGLLGGVRGPRARTAPVGLSVRTVVGYAGATFVVDLGISAIAQVDVLLIGALLSSTAVGSFGAVIRILTVLSYLGIAVSGGVAPRLSAGSGAVEAAVLGQAIRFLVVVQGLVLAPMVVWARPIVGLLLGSRYHSSPAVMRVLSESAFVSAPAAVISLSVTYLGAARRRVRIVLATLALGLACMYGLLRALGLTGAAIADDVVATAYVLANLWICAQLVALDLGRLVRALLRALLAAGAMGLVLFAFGTGHLSAGRWIAGGVLGVATYSGVLLVTREVTVGELRSLPRLLALRR